MGYPYRTPFEYDVAGVVTVPTKSPKFTAGDVVRLQSRLPAYHEAGHAVVARAMGLIVESVTIDASSGHQGHTRLQPDDELLSNVDLMRAHVVCTLSGVAGWAVAFGEMGRSPGIDKLMRLAHEGAPTDLVAAQRLLIEELGYDERDAPRAVTENLELALHVAGVLQRQIQNVGAALLATPTIQGDELERILKGHDWSAQRSVARELLGLPPA